MTIKTINIIFYWISAVLLTCTVIFFGIGAYTGSVPMMVVAGCHMIAALGTLVVWNNRRNHPW